jgi:type I restriction enzyme S subunit
MDLNTFFEHFDTLAEAPNGLQRLRELILDMAVRGKLVPQDPEDEPAAQALQLMQKEKVLAEQARGRKAKKTSSKNLEEDYELDFPLPETWTLATLDSICLFIDYRGKTPQKVNSGIRLVTAKNVRDGFINIEPREFVTEETYESWMTRGLPKPGDVLFTTEAPLGKAAVVDIAERFALAQRVINLHPFCGLDGKFLMWLILSPWFQDELVERATGMTAQGIKAAKLKLVKIPLPPLAEQKRIVAKVDELMTLCDTLEAAQQTRNTLRQSLRASALDALMNATSDTELATAWAFVRDNWGELSRVPEDVEGLRQVIFQQAVEGRLSYRESSDKSAELTVERALKTRKKLEGSKKITKRKEQDPVDYDELTFELPQKWTCIRFGEVADVVSGVTKGRKLAGRDTAWHPYLRVANVQRWKLDLKVLKEIEIPVEELDKYRLQVGDVLLTEGGDWDKLGRSTIWRGEVKDCIHQNHIFRARFLDDGILPEWVVLFTNSYVGRRYFEGAAKRTTNLASINMTQLRFCPLPIPPEEEQKRIVAKVDELMKLCDQLEESLRRQQGRAEALAASAVSALAA